MNSSDETPCDDHIGIPEPSAEAHQRPSNKHQHGGPHQSPLPIQKHQPSELIVLKSFEVFNYQKQNEG